MKSSPVILLPQFQRFDCRGCTYCCRHLVVNVNERERRRIEQAGWEQKLPGQRLFVAYRLHGQLLYHLAHTPEGACVFLGADGRCRIHAEDGLDVKPLACRLYPLVPLPGVEGRRLDLRFDCPAVAANEGRSLAVHQADAVELAERLNIPEMIAPPKWPGADAMSAGEFRALVESFDELLCKSTLPHWIRLRAGCLLLDLLYNARFAKVRRERFVELLGLLLPAVLDDAENSPEPPPMLSPKAGRLFRQWLFLHTLDDRPEDLNLPRVRRWVGRWRRYLQSRQFTRGRGPIPRMWPDWPTATFEQVQSIQGGADEDWEPVLRAMRVKLAAGSFAGVVYYDAQVLAGLTALWLTPALVGWLARLNALAAGRSAVGAEDILAGVRQTHRSFGVSPVFGRISEQFRLHAFARPGVAAAILARYGM